MPNSYAQTQSLTCPQCGQTTSAEIWLIVDTAERPDLLEKVKDGSLHRTVCLHCNQTIGEADAPLLIYHPVANPPILFSPAQRTSAEQDQAHARDLITRLKESLGDAWRDEWLANGVPGIQRALLPAALSDDPEATMRELAEKQQAELERLRRESPQQFLRTMVAAFLQTQNIVQKRAIVENAPELLSDEADAMLGALVKAAQEQNNENARRTFEQHRALLRRCREVGIEQAFAEITGSGGLPQNAGLDRRFQQLIALQQRAKNNPALWPQALNGWQALIAEADERGETRLAANARGNLANTMLSLYEVTAAETWAAQAEALLAEVGRVFTQEGHRRCERRGDEAHATAAEKHYQEVLTYASQNAIVPIYPFRASTALARLHYRRKDWAACQQAGEEAWRYQEMLLQAGMTRTGKENWQREAGGLATLLAQSWLETGDVRQAVFTLERGRAYLLREAMGRFGQDLERLPALGFAALYERFVRACQRFDNLTNVITNRPESSRFGEWQEAQAELRAAVDAIRDEAGKEHPEYRFFLQPLPFEAIREQAADAPLVYLAATDRGGFALVAPPQTSEVSETSEVWALPLPELTEQALRDQVTGPGKEWGGYLGAYFRWRRNPYDDAARQAWFAALETTLAWMGETIMGPLVAELQRRGLPQGALVRLVPTGWLGLLPLHAAALTPGPSPKGRGEHALDYFTFTYTPSAQALYHARAAAQRPADSLLAVRYPDENFQLADQAIRAALDAFPDANTPLLMDAATKAAVLEAFDDHAVLFFFTHGLARFDEPLQSGLLTAGDDRLTLDEIMALRGDQARLAVLSACETGVSPDLENADEVVSLPSGLMQAGVPGVVGSLWTVAESSTALLMSIFFEEWRKNGLTPPQALRRAQQILRDARHDEASRRYFARYLMPTDVAHDLHVEMMLENFAHPFYWAAFTYTGL